MKVAELIKELQKHPGDLEVVMEGCDCVGEIKLVSLQNWSDYSNTVVFLERPARTVRS